MPESVEMPAPVNTTMRHASLTMRLARSSSLIHAFSQLGAEVP
jgi:hypothetical protein